jgi:tRNA(Ile)-lysidine synthase
VPAPISIPAVVQECLNSLPERDAGLVVAVSGGPDSVALIRAVAAVGFTGPIILAHLNHCLRGEESDADEVFVTQLHQQLAASGTSDLRFAHERRDIGAEARAQSANLEAHARHVRYRWLADTARAHDVRWVATGHTANDQAETVLHRLMRGTGLQGLRGIAARRELEPGVGVVRPILSATRADVLGYLASLGQPYREDRSNDNLDRTRNRIRRELIPQLAAQYNTAIVPLLNRLAAQAEEAFRDEEAAAFRLLTNSERPRAGNMVVLDTAAWREAPRRLVREAFRLVWRREGWPMDAMDYAAWDRLAALVSGEGTAIDLPGGIRARRRERVVQVWPQTT